MHSGSKKGKRLISDYRAIGEKADRKVLSLFSSLGYWVKGVSVKEHDAILRCLAVVYTLGVGGQMSIADLSKSLVLSRSLTVQSLDKLSKLSLVAVLKCGKKASYILTPKGAVVLVAFKEFQSLQAIKPVVSNPVNKNDRLAFALLVIGYSVAKKENSIFGILVRYAEIGSTVESVGSDIVAESLLRFYSSECKVNAAVLPNYLGVFKEFTTAGFQQVLQILLSSMKPSVEDYNWLVEFFGEVIEFYYNPARLAYVNLLSENPGLRLRLEGFKKSQEQQIRKEGSMMEVTFNVPSSNVQKFMSMPAHLRAVATRLVLEPLQFVNQELAVFFWST
jgi:predicted transcriptional regulator